MPEARWVHCREHGDRRPAFVCRHLIGGSNGLGFYEPNRLFGPRGSAKKTLTEKWGTEKCLSVCQAEWHTPARNPFFCLFYFSVQSFFLLFDRRCDACEQVRQRQAVRQNCVGRPSQVGRASRSTLTRCASEEVTSPLRIRFVEAFNPSRPT
jgi:hypothetical protein